jgi:ParB family chromosome partitioning protein
VDDGLTVRQLEELVKGAAVAAGSPTGNGQGSTKPAALLALEALLAERLETRVKVELGEKKGKIEIEFADLADLERIFLAMTTGVPT